MRIAIVDDVAPEREKLKNRIAVQLSRLHLDGEIFAFESGEDFLIAAKNQRFTCVFLDIYMEGADGVEVAKALRAFDRACLLVFTTASAGHALEGFQVRAMHYLVKPYTDDELTALFDEIAQRLPDPGKYVAVRVAGGIDRIYLRDILYAEHFQHQIHIHKSDGKTIVTRQTFREFCAGLDDQCFFLCNRGMVTNMEYADDFDGKVFLLKNGEKIPVSRGISKEARIAFGEFLFKKSSGWEGKIHD